MTRRHFVLQGDIRIELDFDETVLGDDEWRERYKYCTVEDTAKHLAWYLGIEKLRLSQVDGFADKDDDQARLIDVYADLWEVEEV